MYLPLELNVLYYGSIKSVLKDKPDKSDFALFFKPAAARGQITLVYPASYQGSPSFLGPEMEGRNIKGPLTSEIWHENKKQNESDAGRLQSLSEAARYVRRELKHILRARKASGSLLCQCLGLGGRCVGKRIHN